MPSRYELRWTNPVDLLKRVLKLGNKAQERRAGTMADASVAGSRSSLPGMFSPDEEGDSAQVKGAQRALSGKKALSLEGLRKGLVDASWCAVVERGLPDVIVAYDPTYLSYKGHKDKQKRLNPGDGFEGYVALNSAVVDPTTGGLLGVAHQALVSADGPDDRVAVDYAPGITDPTLVTKLEWASRQQFLAHMLHVDATAPEGVEIVCVADREFDDGLALRALVGASSRCHFVIRGNEQRALLVEPGTIKLPANVKRPSVQHFLRPAEHRGLESAYVADIVEHLPLIPLRDVPLDARGRVCSDGKNAARIAHLHAGAIRVKLAKRSQRGLDAGIPEEPIWLTLVVVRELEPPPGTTPLEWRLLTDLPATTPTELARIVDAYRFRWRIEEFFRTIKASMGLEKSRLKTPSAIARLLVFCTIKAMMLDYLRAAAGLASGRPPTDEQRKKLKELGRKAVEIEKQRRGKRPPREALDAATRALMIVGLLARLGGWTNRRGASLGNEVLIRGLTTLLHDLSLGHYDWLVSDLG